MEELKIAANSYDKALQSSLKSSHRAGPAGLNALNQVLYHSERALLSEQGLPRRPWFRHQIYAPGFYTGYGVKTLPGVREGIEQRAWDETVAQIEQTATALERYAAVIREATRLLNAPDAKDSQ